MPEFTGQQDLRSTLQTLWRWKWLFLFFLVGAPLVGYLIVRDEPNVYQSSALVGIGEETVNTAVVSDGGTFSTSNVVAIAEIINTPAIADVAAGLLHPRADPGQVAGEVSASGDENTNFVTITAQDQSPTRAADIANAFAQALTINRQRAAVAELNGAAHGVQAQLAHIKRSNTTARAPLEQQLNQLLAARDSQGSDAVILRPATASGTPVAPHRRRTIELGLVIGLLLGLGAIVLAESAHRRIRTPDELEDVLDTPLLGTIAPSALSSQLETTVQDEEAFHMLRIALTSYHAEQPLTSIVVASPGEKEGKTTVASRLALAMARGGTSVILVDADLRRGRLSRKFGVQRDEGLSAVLTDKSPVTQVLVDYAIEDPGPGRLQIVPAGPPQRRASALMSSPQMGHLIEELSDQCDLVIIDTPAALAVGDPLALMRDVSGAILVARMNMSRRRPLRRLMRMIGTAHGTVLGVVAVGVTRSLDYYGYSRSYYQENGGPGGGARERLRRRVGHPD